MIVVLLVMAVSLSRNKSCDAGSHWDDSKISGQIFLLKVPWDSIITPFIYFLCKLHREMWCLTEKEMSYGENCCLIKQKRLECSKWLLLLCLDISFILLADASRDMAGNKAESWRPVVPEEIKLTSMVGMRSPLKSQSFTGSSRGEDLFTTSEK